MSFTTGGLINFTNLSIENGFTALANGGSVLNGKSATAANHYNTYNDTGHITVTDGSSFGTTTASMISVGELTIEGESNIHSVAGKGRINVSHVNFEDDDARLTWHREGSGVPVSSKGTYFGDVSAFQVLTINPTVANASEITPFNFRGIYEATGATFVGDNDVQTEANGVGANKNGFGIMIPGSVIDYEVTAPVANGVGDIKHDVAEVAENNEPLTLDVWATERANVSTQKGRMIVPVKTGTPILPEFTFTPETTDTGSWVKKVEVVSSDVNHTYSETIGEQLTSAPAKWKMDANGNGFSYDVKVTYSNKAEATAKNIIITEDDAKILADITAVTYTQEVKARPFMETSLNETQLNQIKTGLGEDELSKKYPITYTAKDKVPSTTNTDSATANLVVVKNGSTISSEKSFALYAKNASLMLYEAQNLADQPALDLKTHATTIFADNTADTSADLANSYLNTIRSVLTPSVIPVKYTATLDSETIEKSVDITVTGSIFISKATDHFNFGSIIPDRSW